MTGESYICRLIHDNPDNWVNICEEKKISVKKDPDSTYAIFNYDVLKLPDFFDPVVQEARGIIINLASQTVVCWPFRKFGNFHEDYADEIDWDSACVQGKVDGSIIKLWYDFVDERWMWSTNSCIDASKTMSRTGFSFQSMIDETEEAKILMSKRYQDEILSRFTTYIFELVGPKNQVVIHYDKPALYHIGTRRNDSGHEMNVGIGIRKPKSFPLHSLDDCIRAAKELNNEDYPGAEGFVVVDKNWHRIKVKSPEYLV